MWNYRAATPLGPGVYQNLNEKRDRGDASLSDRRRLAIERRRQTNVLDCCSLIGPFERRSFKQRCCTVYHSSFPDAGARRQSPRMKVCPDFLQVTASTSMLLFEWESPRVLCREGRMMLQLSNVFHAYIWQSY